MYGKGAVLADVTVYGPDGPDDIQQYKGFTMSSNPNRYGVVADGIYQVNKLKDGEKLGPYQSLWTINQRGAVPALNDYNPSYPNRQPGYLTGVFIHRPNNNGWAGEKYDNEKKIWQAVSKGCLIIEPQKWVNFNNSLKKLEQFSVQVKRK